MDYRNEINNPSIIPRSIRENYEYSNSKLTLGKKILLSEINYQNNEGFIPFINQLRQSEFETISTSNVLDSYIEGLFRRRDYQPGSIREDQSSRWAGVQEAIMTAPGIDRVFNSSTGLRASTLVFGVGSYTIKGEPVRFDEGAYTRVDFMPGGRTRFDPKKVTESLANGIKGLIELIEAIDQGRFNPASLMTGDTNLHMALIAQRLGFVIVDECRTEDGSINRELESFTIVGKSSDVQERVHQFIAEGKHQRVLARQQRLASAPQPA